MIAHLWAMAAVDMAGQIGRRREKRLRDEERQRQIEQAARVNIMWELLKAGAWRPASPALPPSVDPPAPTPAHKPER
jgi:hypothetical protein